MKMPCKECIVYAICKLKEEIICDEATKYCLDDSYAHTKYNSERIYEVTDYLGKGGAISEPVHDGICFADAFTDEGEKLN